MPHGEIEPGTGRRARTPSTEEVLADINRQINEVAASGQPLWRLVDQPILDDFGQPTGQTQQVQELTEAGNRWSQLLQLQDAIVNSLPADRDRVSASVAAQLAEQRASRAESARQFDVSQQFRESEAEREEERSLRLEEEDQRRTNLNTTLDLLEQDIRRGQLSASEATNRITAATQAANIQRDVLRDQGGRNLRPGTQFFPGLEPTGAVGQIAQSIGLPFPGFQTQGTFGVNPAALSGQIMGAVGPSALPGVDQSILNAANAIANMGVPVVPPTPQGRAQRPPSNGVSRAAAGIAGV